MELSDGLHERVRSREGPRLADRGAPAVGERPPAGSERADREVAGTAGVRRAESDDDSVSDSPDAGDERPSRWRRLPAIERRLLWLLLCAPLLGAIGVVGAELVSDERIAAHLVDAGAAELLGPSDAGPTPLGTEAARYTECTSFSLGLGDAAGEDPVTRAMLGTAYTGCERLGSALDEFAQADQLREGFPYLRYWHGYAVVSRPALALTGVEGARWIAFAISALAIGGMCAAVKRSFGGATTLLLVGPALLTSDMVVAGLSASTAIGSSCAWLGGWMALSVVSRRPTWRTTVIVAALAGATSAYLDLMTTMPGALALTAVGATLGCCAARGAGVSWRIGAAAVVGWIVGLAWMWGAKWLLAAAVLGVDQVDDAVRSQIGFRLSSGTDGVSDSRTQGLADNLGMWWEQPLTPWVLVGTLGLLAAFAIASAWRRRQLGIAWGVGLCALIIVGPVAGWYLALNNHSQIHPQLVYRSLPLAFGGVAALVWVALRHGSAGDAS